MNVKILRKLRKEARRTYYIEYDGYLYCLIFDMKFKKLSIAHHISKEVIEMMIKIQREDYILSKLRELRCKKGLKRILRF